MTTPLTLAAIGSVALVEGIRFLYTQAGELIKQWHARRAAKPPEQERSPTDKTEISVNTPPALGARELRVAVDFEHLDASIGELTRLRETLRPYDEGAPDVPLTAVSALRDRLEGLLGVALTFVGEDRPPTGSPVVEGQVRVGQHGGEAVGVDVEAIDAGSVRGAGSAEVVEPGARLIGVRAGRIGPPPPRRTDDPGTAPTDN